MEISYKLEKFEGPLDLLLHLLDRNKINIYDIPIVEITEQYLDYVSSMDRQDLDLVSDFLVMAATLLEIKAKLLLPADKNEEGEEEDPRAELVQRLLEYKMYKYMANELKDREDGAERMLFKEPTIPPEVAKYEPPLDLDRLLDGLTLAKLQAVFQMVMKRQENKIDPVRSKFGNIKKETVSLEDRITAVIEYAKSHSHFSFRQMLSDASDRLEVVVTFLAVLELMKLGKIYLAQEQPFDDMQIDTLDATLDAEDLEQIEKEEQEKADGHTYEEGIEE